ncbi:sulfotransferase [Gloeocapsa sp. PCC 73106]|uniref:sulfotransferase family protein n=1 Tax=Gloeocapsa sp. PCC 73106 TaxID=102232 RepID=UPI0002AC0577|nr:sulfotransferase [Gloeocapsa sp. PCC 73106]ELR99054.1 sulfotransferase family protein [Gloeocapsa sp. PCC 73106]
MSCNFLILIGAARSGTKLVRDLIATHPDVAKVPYDINYIWRLGNQSYPHDLLSPEQITPEIAAKIRTKLKRFQGKQPLLVEKTVGNCLRVPFVHNILPEARFIHLLRDGMDVVESVYRQWMAPPEWNYLYQKAISFPWLDSFDYGWEYGQNLFKKLLGKDVKKTGIWGVRYPGIDEDLATRDLLTVCAIQWSYCVETAFKDFNNLPSESVLTLHYEDLVMRPVEYLTQIADFVKIDSTPYQQLYPQIDSRNIGKGRRNLTPTEIELILPHMQKALSLLNNV